MGFFWPSQKKQLTNIRLAPTSLGAFSARAIHESTSWVVSALSPMDEYFWHGFPGTSHIPEHISNGFHDAGHRLISKQPPTHLHGLTSTPSHEIECPAFHNHACNQLPISESLSCMHSNVFHVRSPWGMYATVWHSTIFTISQPGTTGTHASAITFIPHCRSLST